MHPQKSLLDLARAIGDGLKTKMRRDTGGLGGFRGRSMSVILRIRPTLRAVGANRCGLVN